MPAFPAAIQGGLGELPDIAGRIASEFMGGKRRGYKPFVAPPPAFAKQLPTEAVQQLGLVDPNGHLQDPAGVNTNLAVKAASTQIGKPYVFGSGPSTSSFDCSDLIQWSYKQMGISLPRTTWEQVKIGRAVDPSKGLQPGDLVFPSPHHVVMYVGNGQVIAAPHTGTVVQYQPISQFGKLYAVRRVLG
jgi:cell wall-associated NlpC family hydrolase